MAKRHTNGVKDATLAMFQAIVDAAECAREMEASLRRLGRAFLRERATTTRRLNEHERKLAALEAKVG